MPETNAYTKVVIKEVKSGKERLKEKNELSNAELKLNAETKEVTITYKVDNEPPTKPAGEDGGRPAQGAELQVKWTDNNQIEQRAVGGKYSYRESTKEVVIEKLKIVSKNEINLYGEITIGAVDLTVRISNMNPQEHWMLYFTGEEKDESKTVINLAGLMDWIAKHVKKENTPTPKSKDVVLPKELKGKKTEIINYSIVIKQFHVNLTLGTFDFWVETKEKQELVFSTIKIKKVGFRITNERYLIEKKEDKVEKKKEKKKEDKKPDPKKKTE